MDIRSATCCFTGHRVIPANEYSEISERLDKTVLSLIERGVEYFCSGGALGFDTLAALCILRLKRRYPQIKLILILPCRTQADRWSAKDAVIYEEIKSRSDRVVYVSDEYTSDCMLTRNRRLCDVSSYCICYLTKSRGGSAYTVGYATRQGLSVYNLADCSNLTKL